METHGLNTEIDISPRTEKLHIFLVSCFTEGLANDGDIDIAVPAHRTLCNRSKEIEDMYGDTFGDEFFFE